MALEYTTVGDDAAPRWALILHGIYGSGANWRTFARKLTERRPEWGAVLVDLRKHGDSQDLSPPHTVAAAATDLAELAHSLMLGGRRVRAVVGHSFGGKVALAYAADHGSELDAVWVLDSSPAPRPGAMREPGNTVVGVLEMLEGLPERFADRAAFVAHIRDQGHPPMLANWLAMNLEPADGGMRFRLDPAAMRELLSDYYQRDLWPVVQQPPCPLAFVVAGASSAVSAADRARLDQLRGARVAVHPLPQASHWLHIDALEPLLDLVVDGLP